MSTIHIEQVPAENPDFPLELRAIERSCDETVVSVWQRAYDTDRWTKHAAIKDLLAHGEHFGLGERWSPLYDIWADGVYVETVRASCGDEALDLTDATGELVEAYPCH